MGASLGVCGGLGENIDAVDRAGHTLQRRRCADALGGCAVTAMMFSIAGTYGRWKPAVAPAAAIAGWTRRPRCSAPRLIPLSASACRSCGIAASTAARTAVSGGDVQLRLLIVQFQRDLQGAQFLRVQVQLGALLAVAVEHQHLLVQRLLPLRAAQLRVELRRRRCGHQCAGRSGRLRWAGGGGATAWLSVGGCCASLAGSGCAVLARSPLVGCGSAALALSPSVADVFAPCQRRSGGC